MSCRLTLVLLIVTLTACGPDAPETYPERLSDWQLMQVSLQPGGTERLVLADDVVPYELATPLFSDYAQKLRTIRFPDAPARYRENEPIEFPPGTVISKTFYYPRNTDGTLQLTARTLADHTDRSLDLSSVELIETRLLVREEDGWAPLPYVWNADQSEATLRIQGDIRRLSGTDDTRATHEFNYLVPNRNECGGCHITDEEAGELRLIGPTARQLNRPLTAASTGSATQLQNWAEQGWLVGLPDAHDTVPSVPLWEPSATDHTKERARAWLDINCAHCHRPGGPADNSGLFLHAAESSMVRLGRCKPPVAAGRGTGGNRFSLQPGAPEQSILLHRIASTEPDVMMPELGRSLVQQEALTLVSRWIAQMPGDCP